MFKILTIFGTRPEAIKLAPVLVELRKRGNILSHICVTAQHRQMLDQVLNVFGIIPDIDLDLMRPCQSLSDLTAHVITEVDRVLAEVSPNLVMVQGDTTTVAASAMAAFYRKIPVAHVEAGLRSGNIDSPFPEELNRRVASLIATYHFAPTERTRQALLREGVPDSRIFLTGNPVIDALHIILRQPSPSFVQCMLAKMGINGNARSKKLILVTAHRRENFGYRIENICAGLKSLAARNRHIVFLYPVHLNPRVKEPVYRILSDVGQVYLIDPVDYNVMAHLLNAAYIVLTDSGGIQEEAPALGKPVLVMRTETERPEGIDAGTARLVGTDAECIVTETERLLNDRVAYRRMARSVNPYGDGRAAERIANVISSLC